MKQKHRIMTSFGRNWRNFLDCIATKICLMSLRSSISHFIHRYFIKWFIRQVFTQLSVKVDKLSKSSSRFPSISMWRLQIASFVRPTVQNKSSKSSYLKEAGTGRRLTWNNKNVIIKTANVSPVARLHTFPVGSTLSRSQWAGIDSWGVQRVNSRSLSTINRTRTTFFFRETSLWNHRPAR